MWKVFYNIYNTVIPSDIQTFLLGLRVACRRVITQFENDITSPEERTHEQHLTSLLRKNSTKKRMLMVLVYC